MRVNVCVVCVCLCLQMDKQIKKISMFLFHVQDTHVEVNKKSSEKHLKIIFVTTLLYGTESNTNTNDSTIIIEYFRYLFCVTNAIKFSTNKCQPEFIQ